MKLKHNRILALFLAVVLTFGGVMPVGASTLPTDQAGAQSLEQQTDPAGVESMEQPNALDADQSDVQDVGQADVQNADQPDAQDTNQTDDSSDSLSVSADYLYAELSEDETIQYVVVKLDTLLQPEDAVLLSKSSNGEEQTAAFQVIENFVAFQLTADENRTFESMTYKLDGASAVTNLAPLENGETLNSETFSDAASETASQDESGIASHSLDEGSSPENADSGEALSSEEKSDVEECVITTDLDEKVSEDDISSTIDAVTPSVQSQNGLSRAVASSKKTVVLDPGHGSAGTGTYRNWGSFVIDEAIITLKISNYTKAYLEANYANINVYMTRTAQSQNPSLEARVNYGVSKNADIFVSQHVNATGETTTSANGVLAMVPQVDSSHNYHANAAEESKKLARSILDELVKLGFNDMKFQYRLTENGSTYSDGSYADYYGIVKHCRENNLPGTIIEHGFANNYSDAVKLNNETMLKKMGEADARGIAAYLGLSSGSSSTDPSITTGWVKENGHWYYYDKAGKKVTGWAFDGGNTYYMDSNGIMLTGWQKIDGKWYYMSDAGALCFGWLLLNGKWYYTDGNGAMVTGLVAIDNKTYYMNSDGIMLTGWQQINGKWYYFNSSGVYDDTKIHDSESSPNTPVSSKDQWISSGGLWWYRHADGSFTKSDWENIGGVWYYFDSIGWMTTGWQKINDTWYYMSVSGARLTGWQKVGAVWYYMNASGAMLTGWQKIGNDFYYLNASGAMLTGWQKIGNVWYYMNASGAMTTGWQKVGNVWYYMNASGAMLTGWQKIGNATYYLNASGAMLTGWQQLNGTWYYMSTSGSILTLGWHKIGTKWYYMDASGAMAANTWIGTYYVDASGAWVENSSSVTPAKWILSGSRWWYRHADGSFTTSGWESIDGKWYLFDADGWMLTGWQRVKNDTYYMDASGQMFTGTHTIDGISYTFLPSGALIAN